MTSQNPATPIKVPASAANYTMATLDPELRTQINQALIDDGLVTKIQDHLLHSLHAHPANWPTAVENHAIALLRSGEVTTFPALLRRVIEDVRRDTSLAPTTNGAEANGKKSNGTPAPAAADSNGNPAVPNLALPSSVVEDALKVTRESLETGSSNTNHRRERPLAKRYHDDDDPGKATITTTAAAGAGGQEDTSTAGGADQDMADGEDDGEYAASFTSENSSALVEALRMAGLYDGTPRQRPSAPGP